MDLPIERRSTLVLLAEAGRAMGFRVQIESAALLVDTGQRCVHLPWPPVAAVRKSQIADLLHSEAVRPLSTTPADPDAPPPWLPCYVKPDVGARGENHYPVHTLVDWHIWDEKVQSSQMFVVQPLVQGVEFRVTMCRTGAFAAARLVKRCGVYSLWQDATDTVPRAWLAALLDITLWLRAPGLGCDIIQTARHAYLLDVNTNPGLAIHIATDCPRDIAPAFFCAWLNLVDEPCGSGSFDQAPQAFQW